MKYLPIFLMLLTGCIHTHKPTGPQMSAPTGGAVVSEHVAKASLSVEKARQKAETIKTQGAKPGDSILADLATDLTNTTGELSLTQIALEKYKDDVAHQTILLNAALDQKNAALEKADYWHGKQVKALQELWFWRGIAGLICLAALGYVGWLLFKPRIF